MRAKASLFLVFFLIFLLPTQLSLHFWPTWAYIYGFRIDFLAPALYLTDIFIIGLLFFNPNIFIKNKKQFLVIGIFALINILLSISKFESLYRWVKVLEFAFLSFYIYESKFITVKAVAKTLLWSTAVFSLIGIAQFLKGGTIGGIFYWLGERAFSLSTPGIALVVINGVDHLRAYSTFSHPNSLAGYLGTSLIFVLMSRTLKRNWVNNAAVLIVSFCLFLTFSLSAYFGLLFVLLLTLVLKNQKLFNILTKCFFWVGVLASMILPVISPNLLKLPIEKNLGERLDLSFISGKVISSNFLTGVGLGNFISKVTDYKGIFSYSWLLQPVHNIFLLIFTETGIAGLLLVVGFIYKILSKQISKKNVYLVLAFVFVIFTGLSDHYWLTLQQNFLLLSLLTGFALR